MNGTARIFMAITACLIFISCNNRQQVNNPDDIRAIEEMSAARADAFNQGNAAGISIYFTEDGILMAPGSPALTGREAVERYYQQIFDQYVTELDSYYEEVKISGDFAFGRGIAEVTLTPHNGGEKIISTSKYVNILHRQEDGSWLTTHDIWNENH